MGTTWKTGEIWLRRHFSAGKLNAAAAGLRIQHDEDAEVYVNGKKIAEFSGFVGAYFTILCDALREALREASVALGDLDRVEPPLWTPLQAGLAITVTRVRIEREEHIITAAERVVRDEFLLPAESRLLDEGSNGIEEFTYHAAYDGATLLGRELASRKVVVAPRPPRNELH